MQNFLFTLLGGVLTLLGGIVAEYVRHRISTRKLCRSIRTLLLDETENLAAVFDRLIANRKQAGSFRLAYLTEIASVRTGFDRNRDQIITNLPDELRKSVGGFYHKLNMACVLATGAENLYLSKSDDQSIKDFVNMERGNLLADFHQLEATLPSIRTQLTTWKV